MSCMQCACHGACAAFLGASCVCARACDWVPGSATLVALPLCGCTRGCLPGVAVGVRGPTSRPLVCPCGTCSGMNGVTTAVACWRNAWPGFDPFEANPSRFLLPSPVVVLRCGRARVIYRGPFELSVTCRPSLVLLGEPPRLVTA